ncbi:MAG: DEAD/DEAH box helicase [Runella slithyformis]|nr:MAG: DEAD/DEAH box helicase [Runella slithyformis]TAF98111.1 MAG: DEAD/DEAH box helicase [Runella sp.]TAG22629.1 MAG: DEAD/DEAH box helicase [Cytophagales bacterium]TAG41666.1 MAG: DEAD/DEAH box helicase [Cytophagia bacterium]TAG74816.1 MAG: DEAD/DEAH box helicase [Runella slithyformis]
MKLQFDASQAYQLEAIQRVIEVLEGQPLAQSDFEQSVATVSFQTEGASIVLTERGIANQLCISDAQILQNVQAIQFKNGLAVSAHLEASVSDDGQTTHCPLNFTIEMETGTGKTYTFLRTVYELNKTHGFKKFVIVVPSVAIREGILKNLELTHAHFQAHYSNPPVNFVLYDSAKLNALRNFATSNAIQILVINIDSFAKDNNVINTLRETGVKPIEYLQTSRPIVIVDEPQNMESDLRKAAIGNLNPLFTLRYSATHRHFYNLLYSLNPVQAYDLGLVKQIEVDGIVAEANFNTPFVELLGIQVGKKSLKAKVAVYANEKSGVKRKELVISPEDDLLWLSGGRDVYKEGYILTSIHRDPDCVRFSNGTTIYLKQAASGTNDEVAKFQIERTIKRHFEKELRYWQLGSEESRNSHKRIKVLSLFFIDKVANYRTYDSDGTPQNGKFAIWFEEIFERLAKEHQSKLNALLFTDAPKETYFLAGKVHESDIPTVHAGYFDVKKVHNGYFASDKNRLKDTNGTTKADTDTYALIMKDKERLLSTDEPLRFIFSHSALREGWDNPNVFQICTLNESRSELKKRQEIGRGLRLCVDGTGARVFDKKINVLTVIANETYEEFSESLQKEIQEETSVEFLGRIKNARDKAQVQLTKHLTPENCPLFFEIWDKIKFRTRYRVAYDTELLIEKAVAELRDLSKVPSTKRPMLEAKRATMNYGKEGIEKTLTDIERKRTDAIKYPVPDVYAYIQGRLDITRQTIFQILKRSDRVAELVVNPQLFLDNVVGAIQKALNALMIDGIKYERLNEPNNYEMKLFENEEIETYLSNLFAVTAHHKTLYNFIAIDSEVEHHFARECEADTSVKFFFKLPKAFKIPTPVGNYTPDWAVIFENDHRIYFVVETKSVLNADMLRGIEQMKIQCGKAHFIVAQPNGVFYKVATQLKELV